MHLELAHIEQTKQIKQKSEYTSCNPEQTAAGIMMPLTLDHMHTAAIKEGVEENIIYGRPGREPRYTGMSRRMGPRRTYACATPPCLDSLYETVDNIIVWHNYPSGTAIPLYY